MLQNRIRSPSCITFCQRGLLVLPPGGSRVAVGWPGGLAGSGRPAWDRITERIKVNNDNRLIGLWVAVAVLLGLFVGAARWAHRVERRPSRRVCDACRGRCLRRDHHAMRSSHKYAAQPLKPASTSGRVSVVH